MGSSNSTLANYSLDKEDRDIIANQTGFTKQQINRLFSRFQALDVEGKGYLTRNEMLNLKMIMLNPLGERIVDRFFFKSSEQKLYFSDFCKTFAIFRPITKYTRDDDINGRNSKIQYLFNLIDTDGDGQFSKTEVYDVLEMMMGAKMNEEVIDKIATRVIEEAELDHSRDGFVSMEEFISMTKRLDVAGRMSFVSLAK